MKFTPLKLIIAKTLTSPHFEKACKIYYNGVSVLGFAAGATTGAVLAVEKNYEEYKDTLTFKDFLFNNGRIFVYSGCGAFAGGIVGKGVAILSPVLMPAGAVYLICKNL